MKLDIVIPDKLRKEEETDNYGKFIAEPFEPGYGHTIGNSLRRILLSSLEGASVVGIRFKNVMHEYQAIKGVKEDVLVIMMNLKLTRFKMFTDGIETLTISVKGPGTVTAADIKTTQNIEVLNKDQYIATVNSTGSFECELYVTKGRGYVSFDQHDRAKYQFPVDVIYTDSLFSPVKKVNFEVETARVGQKVNYDKLVIEIWTDGTVKPLEALIYATKILRDSLKVFYGSDEESIILEKVQEEQEEETFIDKEVKDKLDLSVNTIELSVRSQNCLKAAKIKTIGELIRKKEPDLLNYKNFGKKSLNEITAKLKEMGLSLGMDLRDIKKENLASIKEKPKTEDEDEE